MPRTLLEVGPAPFGPGRAVYATRTIPADTLLMDAPLLLVPAAQRDDLTRTVVDDYVYEWDEDGTAALVLGISSICNHADEPNAFLWLYPEDTSAQLWTTSRIRAGEEVTVSYRADGRPDPLWFEDARDDRAG
ncbi:MAG: SET domain-containing protein-lysine N-methyltransferase [Nitriliruptoraceae bacterium]|nr:SET domain-containing protein-lysine N-methyltransferase [Nitriliruptoraceae bacterium]